MVAANRIQWKIKSKAKAKTKSKGKVRQRHVHEFLGSTKLAEEGDDRHNHRFAGVTGEAIPFGKSHVHVIKTNTDFLDHHHQLRRIVTGPAIPVGNGKHIHFVKGTTTFDDGHVHAFNFATLIDRPLV
ncbi:YmaF family protein [Brevibacillus migulae]|uniref:YmaF family protein n=1 Tax=Brevibacillus migulae TaxID=1644114 RepID=UPI00106EDD62|nr:YmaF family protein [Brevibacillus migulae]